MERGGATYTYHRDALGSITEITDETGALVERYEYDVYGAAQLFDKTDTRLFDSAIGNPIRFTGRWYDAESGNYDYRARIYSPRFGRFLQTDPLGYVDGLNPYAYARNNPVRFTDPTGHQSNPFPYIFQNLANMGDPGIAIGRQMQAEAQGALAGAQQAYQTVAPLVAGDFAGEGNTATLAGQIALAIAGADVHLDVTGVAHDFCEWEWSWGHVAKTGIDVAAVLPLLGALKYWDEVAILPQEAAQLIAKGHARTKHTRFLADEADELGILLHESMERATKTGDVRYLDRNRAIFYDEMTGRVIIVNPKDPDLGTSLKFEDRNEGRKFFETRK